MTLKAHDIGVSKHIAKYSDAIEVPANVRWLLTNTENIAAYERVRAEVVGDARPAFMMQVVNQMIRPEILVEIEIVAAKAV